MKIFCFVLLFAACFVQEFTQTVFVDCLTDFFYGGNNKMIDFYINGTKVDVQIEDEQTVSDVLVSFEKTCEENHVAVIGITVDGKQITADIFDEESQKPLSDKMKFEFTVV